MKYLFLNLLIVFSMAMPSFAGQDFSQKDLSRIRNAKSVLREVDLRSLDEIVEDLDKTGYPRDNLVIYEAIAATFRDIQQNYEKGDLKAKERLLEKIQMNMAYFQLGGPDIERRGESELNILIRRKLKEYLPKIIWKNQALFYTLD